MRLLLVAANDALGVEGGRIVAPEGRFDAVVELAEAELRPGLINAHDHLHRNHYGRLGAPPYANAYRWAADIQKLYRDHIAERHRTPRREALLAGAWKNLFAGVTCVVHHDPWEPDFEEDFPLRVVRLRSADSLGMSESMELAGEGPLALHVAEGVDAVAAGEVDLLAEKGLLGPNLIAVHCVGVPEQNVAALRDSGAAIVWCPTSNLFLFGRTAPAPLLEEGIDVLLGSDSLLTGAGDLLDELRCARSLGLVDDARLAGAVGEVAARRLGVAAPTRELGAPANLVLLRKPLLEASAGDVALVLVDGAVRVADAALAPSLGPFARNGRLRKVGGVERWTTA
jgi:cytosine/adenosine deaminase-related metal-dependent hydrolase